MDMDSPDQVPDADSDIEAQLNRPPETRPEIIPNLAPTTNPAVPQLLTSADPQPAIAPNPSPNENAAVSLLPSSADPQPAIIPNDPPPTTNTAAPLPPTSADPQPQATNTNQNHNENASAQRAADKSQVQRDDNQGDSSDGLWSIYLTEAGKQDTEVTESWKGDTDGIIFFTGLFSATVAAFIIESYKQLSPDSGDTTNALLTQISGQLVNISNGSPLASVVAQSSQPFKPTASAVRVNVFWFTSLILSLNCALSATLMQQWARRYLELAQRRGAFHRRGRMRAYIFDGLDRFGMARAVATMPALLHISVFLFFAGLVEFLFPIHKTVAYATLGCVVVSLLAYANLTVLPNIYLNCPYGTPLSGLTWRISQFSAFVFLWTILGIQGLYRRPLSILRSSTDQRAPQIHEPKRWWELLEEQVKIHRQQFSRSLRKSVELSAYGAQSTVVTSALEWTLTALDEDTEIEDFAARVPGFFDSRVVPDATLAVLPLMSHEPNTDPIFGSRLNDLLKTCIAGTSLLEEEKRKHRLRVCLNCLWCFVRAYNQPGFSQSLPSYFPDVLATPAFIRRVRAEEDPGARVIGRCYGALIVNKLVADFESHTGSISHGGVACISAILDTKSHDVQLLLSQPGAVGLVNMTSLTFDEIGGLVTNTVPSGVLDVVQQTLGILSQAVSSQENDDVPLDQLITIINGSDGTVERTLLFRLIDLLNMCMTSRLNERVRTSCLRVSLKGLWHFVRTFNQLESSVPFPYYISTNFANPDIVNSIYRGNDLVAQGIGRCVGALVVNKLAADLNSRTDPTGYRNVELRCISTILGVRRSDVTLLLGHPGAIEFLNIVFLAWPDIDSSASTSVPSDVLDVVQKTFTILSQALPAGLIVTMRPDGEDALMKVSDGIAPLGAETYSNVLRMWMKNLWRFTREQNDRGNSKPLPSYVSIVFTNPEVNRRIRGNHDFVARVIGRCVGALVVNKLAADISSRTDQVRGVELECLSYILGVKSEDVVRLLRGPGAIQLSNIIFLARTMINDGDSARIPWDISDMAQQTFDILSQALPVELYVKVEPNPMDFPINIVESGTIPDIPMGERVLSMCLMNLWNVIRGSDEPGNSVPLPSYVYCAFTDPETTRRIYEGADYTTALIGRCVGVLVVNKLAVDTNSPTEPIGDAELECLSAILRTESDDVKILLRHPGAIQFTNMVFHALNDFSSFPDETVHWNLLDLVPQTFRALSQALPPELITEMRLNQIHTPYYGAETSALAEIYRSVLTNLWHVTRDYNEPGNSVSLPSYVCIAFTNPEMTRRIHQVADFATQMLGLCIEALVANKLIPDAVSHTVPISDAELACLSAILGTEIHDVRLCLSQPGTIELINLASLASGAFSSMRAVQMPPDTRTVLQQTLDIICQALPAQGNPELPLDQTVDQVNDSDDKFERAIAYRIHGLLKMCVPGASSLAEGARTSCLRMCLKSLWRFAEACHQTSSPLPSYFPLILATPEIVHQFQTERDPVARVTGRCFGALVVCKLLDAFGNLVSYHGGVQTPELACISAILGTEQGAVYILSHQLHHRNFRNVVSLLSGEIDTLFTAAGMPTDVLRIAQDTLYIVVNGLGRSITVPRGPAAEKWRLLQEICSDIRNAPRSDRLKNDMVNALHRLWQISTVD